MLKGSRFTVEAVPYRKLFLSRWSALIWAGGILWTAVDVAGVSPSILPDNAVSITGNASTGDPEMDNEIALLNSVMSGN
jgi:hypothetical protein